MSQRSQPEDICKWSAEECRQNLHVLPKILGDIQNAESPEKQLENVQLLCVSFLPVIDVEAVETLLLCELTQKIRECFRNNLNSLGSVATEAEESITQAHLQLQAHLQFCIELITSLNNVIEHFCQSEKELQLYHYSSLPPAVLELIQTSYTHCKESANIYGDLLSVVSDHLSNLFKKAHSLQVGFLALVDKTIVPTNASEGDVEALCQIIYSVFEVGEIASSLDKKIMLTLWKALSRWCCQHKTILFNRLDIGSMLASLANDMIESVQYLFVQEEDEKSFIRKVKVLGFQMKVLVKLVKEYDGCLLNCVPTITALLLQILSNTPPAMQSEGFPPNYQNEFQQQVVTAVGPLVQCLVGNHEFAVEVTKASSDEGSQSISRLLLNLLLLDILPNCSDEMQNYWIKPNLFPEDTPRVSIIHSVLREFSNAYFAGLLPLRDTYLLPGAMHDGKPQRFVTLYEHTCTQICAFVACIPHELFSVVEEALLNNVLGKNLHSAMLAIDVWCFIARYSTADLCSDHCAMAANLLKTTEICNLPQNTHLIILLRRLLNFTSPEHRINFLENFPVKENMYLWSLLPLSCFNGSAAEQVLAELLSQCLECIRSWLEKSSYTVADAQSMKIKLTCLTNFYQCDSSLETQTSRNAHEQILTYVVQLWTSFPPVVIIQYEILQNVVSSLSQLTLHLVKFLDTNQMLSVIYAVEKILSHQPSTEIKLSVLELVSAVSTQRMPPSAEYSQLLNLIPVIINNLLQDKCCVVFNEALHSFIQIAQLECDESIVTGSLNNSAKLQQVVSDFFSQMNSGLAFEPTVDEIRQQADTMKKFHESEAAALFPASTWPTETIVVGDENDNTVEHPSHSIGEVDHRVALEALKNVVGELEARKEKDPLPDWAKDELRIVNNRLSALLA